MSFLAQLTIEDKEMNVLECTFRFSQGIDHGGRPTTLPRGGIIHILLESTDRTGFFEWMISRNMLKDGEIIFFKRDMMASAKTIKFKGAYCIDYMEEFNAEGEYPMRTRIQVSAEEINVNGTTYTNTWPVL